MGLTSTALWLLVQPTAQAANTDEPGITKFTFTDPSDPTVQLGPECWGLVHNPHNSGSDPGRDYISAKTNIHCDDPLPDGYWLRITNALYIWDSTAGWSLMKVNISECPAGTQTGGHTQCKPNNSGRWDVMEAGVHGLCNKGSREDYLQTSSATLSLGGQIYNGSAIKAAYNVRCRGK